MATKPKIVDPSFRIGCGRYRQDAGVLACIAEEILRLKVCRPFLLGGERALALARPAIEKSLQEASLTGSWYVWHGFCEPEHCHEVIARDDFAACDCVVGIGGGICMDAAKLCAVLTNRPVILVPTSSATCAACAPLSVTYNAIGQPLGSKHHPKEVNAVLADMDILSRQPARLFLAGVYDALAKKLETAQRIIGQDEALVDIGLRSSFELACFSHDSLLKNYPQALKDMEQGKSTKAVYDCVYISLCLTGVISGLARGSNQTAVAHKIYESCRKLFPEKATKYLHGELVAMGLIAQLYYNMKEKEAFSFRQTMQENRMPVSLTEMGLTGDAVDSLYNAMLETSAMAGTTEEEHQRLKQALMLIR